MAYKLPEIGVGDTDCGVQNSVERFQPIVGEGVHISVKAVLHGNAELAVDVGVLKVDKKLFQVWIS